MERGFDNEEENEDDEDEDEDVHGNAEKGSEHEEYLNLLSQFFI